MERASGGRRREEALVNGLRQWRLRGSVGAEARQCPLKLCQSGLDNAERDRAATVDVAVEGTQASPHNSYRRPPPRSRQAVPD